MPGGLFCFSDLPSVVQPVRFSLQRFEFEDQGVAALFRLELARLVVDTNYRELLEMRRGC